MTTKFVFDYSAGSVALNADASGYDVVPAGGGNVPSKVGVVMNKGSPAKCDFDVYYFNSGDSLDSPDYDAPTGFQIVPTAYHPLILGCKKLGYYSSSVQEQPYGFEYTFNSNGNFNNQRTTVVTSMRDTTLNKNYCAFSVNLNDGESCSSLKYDDGTAYYYFANSSQIKLTGSSGVYTPAAPPTLPITAINITCDTKVIPYSFANSTPSFNPTTKRLEFIPLNNKNLDCQYHDGDNYMAFACSEDSLSVDAVQYKCGL